MKRNPLVPIVLVTAVVLAVACKKKPESAVASQKLSKKDPVDMTAAWPVGKSLHQDFESKSTQTFPQMNTDNNQRGGMRFGGGNMESTLTVTFALKPQPPGSKPEEKLVDFELADYSMTSGFGDRTMSSGLGGESLEPVSEAAIEIAKTIPGSKVRLVLNDTNYVLRFAGLGDLQQKISRSSGGGRGGFGGGRGGFGMGGGGINDTLLRQIAKVHQPLPNRSVKPGDTWKTTLQIDVANNMGVLVVPVDCEFTGWEKVEDREVARIDYKGQIKKPEPQNTGGGFFGRNRQGPAMNLENGEVEGSAWFDPSVKVVTDWNVSITGKIPMVFNGGFGRPGGGPGGPGGRRGNATNNSTTTPTAATPPPAPTTNYIQFAQAISVKLNEIKDEELPASDKSTTEEAKPVEAN